MNPSFVFHVSKTISRQRFNQAVASQLQAKRAFSARGGLTFWGCDSLPSSTSSLLVMVQPVKKASVSGLLQRQSRYASTMRLNEHDPKDDGAAGAGGGGAAANNGHGHNDDGHGKGGNGGNGAGEHDHVYNTQLQKPSVPEIYPQVLALPIARRPLFPGFYKAVVVKDPHVTAAIKELLKRGQPYVGAFLLKDEDLDVDVIQSMDQVHNVGVFAQITSVFPASAGKDGKDDDGSLTAVLYPHRRIKMTSLLPNASKAPEASIIAEEPITKQHEQGEKPKVASEADANAPAATTTTTVQDAAEPFKEEAILDDARSEDTLVEELDEKAMHGNSSSPYATSFLRDYDISLASVENLEDLPYSKKSPLVRAVTSEIVSVFKDIASLNPLFRDQIASFSMSQSAGNVFEEPAKLADFAAAVSTGEPNELQEVLETLAIDDRLQKSLLVLKKELMNAQLQNKISKEVENKIAKRQREYYLMEQLKGIKKELGLETDGKDKLVEGFKERAEKLAMPEAVKKVFDEEINKLAHLEPAASEFNVTRNYLDWLTQLPWGQRSHENFNMKHAKRVLDEDHYGLKDVKDRIMEFIAVSKLRGSVEGKILCLSGPPGVGKTSIGKSIAHALDREFYRFSVGGLTDVAEIKGHRRTYVGAMPGKVVQALKKVQTENPLILIDEIDKIGRGHQGDPSSALLELLDPEQNSSFLDHYMDLPIDLSKVLFVCTANVLDTIPGPLLDRMEVIQLSGYIAEEKSAIAEKYLVPTAKKASGLEHVNVNLTSDAIDALIKNYCRESGVRNLKKQVEKVFRKAALNVVNQIGADKEEEDENKQNTFSSAEGEEANATAVNGDDTKKPEREPLTVPEDIKIDISASTLRDYVGPAIFQSDRLYENTPPGVVMGLAWTSMGGSSLYIESVLESALSPKSTPSLNKTGQLGDVMKESSSIAYTFARSLMGKHFPKNRFFDKAKLHLHCPAGAVPKDGPSAGITMATALVSLALDHPVPSNIAMTGELTLTGKVLQIGGLKEKTIAAKRSQVDTILFPKDNQADWDDLPDYIKEGMTGIAVDTYDDVFKICFKDVVKEKANHLWEEQLKEDEIKKELVDA
ncbi:ATP-dependent protease La [Gongronella butleri]|nr:ATP-dependent protease La [Gongronella butleri]